MSIDSLSVQKTGFQHQQQTQLLISSLQIRGENSILPERLSSPKCPAAKGESLSSLSELLLIGWAIKKHQASRGESAPSSQSPAGLSMVRSSPQVPYPQGKDCVPVSPIRPPFVWKPDGSRAMSHLRPAPANEKSALQWL